MLDHYLEDKIFELAELMISDNIKGKWFETPSDYSGYVSHYTTTKIFCEDLAKRLNKAGYVRDAEGSKIDWKWMYTVWNHGPNSLRNEGGYNKNDGTFNLEENRNAVSDGYNRMQAMKQTERLC